MRWDDLRWMPNVRRLLQRRGLTFENSFAPYPLCCPSRASFLTGEYAHNHHVYSHEDPFGFASFHDRRTIATVLQKAGYRTALVGKYLNGYGQQPVRRTGRVVPALRAAGLDAVAGRLRPSLAPVGPGPRQHLRLLRPGAEREPHHQVVPGALLHRGDGGADATAAHASSGGARRPGSSGGRRSRRTTALRSSPTTRDRVCAATGSTTTWVTPARPDWVKGRFDRQITHGSGTPLTGSAEEDVSDKPRYLRRLPELSLAERAAETDVTRQRAESLFVLDVQIGRTISRLSASGQLAQHRHHVHLGQRLLPRRAPQAAGQDHPARALPPGAADHRRSRRAGRQALRPGGHGRHGTHPRVVRRSADARRRRHRPEPVDRAGRQRVGPGGGDRGDDARGKVRRAPPARTVAAEHPGTATRAVEAHPLLHRGGRALRPQDRPARADEPLAREAATPGCSPG